MDFVGEIQHLEIFTQYKMNMGHRSPIQNDLNHWSIKLFSTLPTSLDCQFDIFSKIQKKILTVNQLQFPNDWKRKQTIDLSHFTNGQKWISVIDLIDLANYKKPYNFLNLLQWIYAIDLKIKQWSKLSTHQTLLAPSIVIKTWIFNFTDRV
jgi:hypothetical protein